MVMEHGEKSIGIIKSKRKSPLDKNTNLNKTDFIYYQRFVLVINQLIITNHTNTIK